VNRERWFDMDCSTGDLGRLMALPLRLKVAYVAGCVAVFEVARALAWALWAVTR